MRWKHLIIFSALLLTSCSTGLDAGRKALKSGDYDEAQKQAIIAISTDPRNPEVYYLSTEASLGRGQYSTALKSAEFASALDGGSEKSEQLIRKALAGSKDWDALCEAGFRAVQKGQIPDASEQTAFETALEKLSGKAAAFGCIESLGALGVAVSDDAVKAAYADELAMQGKNLDAYELEITTADPRVSQLRASRRLFALKRQTEGAELLQKYVSQGDEATRESRISEAANVCDEYRQWNCEIEFLAMSQEPQNEILRGIALRRSFRPDEANEVFRQHFERADQVPASVLEDVEMLCSAGYGETAAEAIAACESCTNDVEISFKAADLLYRAGQSSATASILTKASEKNETDSALQVRVFNWYRERKMTAQALASAEKAAKLGVQDDDFQKARLELYLNAREIRQFERVSEEWIASQKAPAAKARTIVATLESKRSNWQNIVTTLTPLAEANAFTDESKPLYYKALKNLRRFSELYSAIEKFDANMPQDSKSTYFEDPEAESEFMKCLAPMLSGNDEEKMQAELLVARYDFLVKSDENAGYEAVDRALNASGKTAYGYQNIVHFLSSTGAMDKSIEYAKAWCNAYPADSTARFELAMIWLRHQDTAQAAPVFTEYYNLESDKLKTLRSVYKTFDTNNEQEAGLAWLEARISDIPNSDSNADYVELLTETRSSVYQSSNKRSAYQPLRNQAIEGYRKLLGMRPEKAIEYAYELNRLNDTEDALAAFKQAEGSGLKLSASNRQLYAQLMIKNGEKSEDIHRVIDQTTGEKDIFNMITMLESEQALEYGDVILEALLSDESADTRLKAYGYLSSLYMSRGDRSNLKRVSAKLENGAANNANLRLKLVETALATNDFDEALRHLTWLQAMRPDAREVMSAEIRLARRAPNHAGAQALLSSTIDAAEGNYHRLDWLSQLFEQYGDTQRALYFAEKAAASSGAALNPQLIIRLIQLNLRAGRPVDSDEFKQLITSLERANQWNSENIVTIAEEAQTDGYYDQAQLWMLQAIDKSPENKSLKSKRLVMALEAESEGQIANSIEKAIEPPMADIMTPLNESGAYYDAISAIEMLEQNGEYGTASDALTSNLNYYLEAKGVIATKRELETLADNVPSYRFKASEILAKQYLMGDAPCEAMKYISELENPTVLARMLTRCTDAHESIMTSIQELRSSMTDKYRTSFDKNIYQALVNNGEAQAAEAYAQETGLSATPLDEFKRQINSGNTLGALNQLAHNDVEPQEIAEVAAELSAHGYHLEAIDYLRNEMSRIPQNDLAYLSATAILPGAKDDIFVQHLANGNADNLSELTSIEKAQVVSEKTLEKWLHETPTYKMSSVLEIAMSSAATNPSLHDSILSSVKKEIASRGSQNSLFMTASQAAVHQDLHKDALDLLKSLVQIIPSSDYIHRMISREQAMTGDEKAAWNSLEEGSRCTNQLIDYWKRAAEMHVSSSTFIRQNINAARRMLQPHKAELLTEATALELEAGNLENAANMAKAAFSSGRNSVISDLADAYESANALSSMPSEIIEGSTSSALSAQAKVLLASGDKENASIKFSESARLSPWPPAVYAKSIDQYLEQGDLNKAEQQIALWLERYPHSSSAFAYRAALSLEKQKAEDAWNDYLSARKRSFETDSWIGILIRATAKLNQTDFALQLYHYEKSHGSLNETIWLNEAVHYYLNESAAQKRGISSKEYAAQGLRYIDVVLNAIGPTVQNDEPLRFKYEQLKQKAEN